MERLTERLENGVINVKYASQHETAIHRLVTIEDILGDEYDLDRLRELVEADQGGRCVVPVVHGKWEEVEELCGDIHYMCSACGIEWYFIEGTPKENGTHYCPNCGAKMDG